MIKKGMSILFILVVVISILSLAVNFGDSNPDDGEADAGSILGTFNTQTGNFTSTRSDNNIYFGVGRNILATAAANMTLSFNMSKLSTNSSIKITEINLSVKYCHAGLLTSACDGNSLNVPLGTPGGMSILIYNSTNWVNISKLNATTSASEIEVAANVSGFQNYSRFISPDGFVNISFEFAWSGVGRSAFLNDHTNLTISYDKAPLVVLSPPSNNAQFVGVSNISFNCNVSDDFGLVNVTLFHNISNSFLANQTRNITGTSNTANFNLTNIGVGDYLWNCLASDNVNLSSFAPSNFTFSVLDNIAPAVNIVSPTPTDGTNQTTTSIFVNATSADTSLSIDSCILELNDVNQTMTKIGSGSSISCFINKTGVIDGGYFFRVYSNDSRNNMGVSTARNITVDTTGPEITFISPADDNNSIVGRSYTFVNTSVIDSVFVDTCTLEFNGINQSMTKIGTGKEVICSVNKTSLSDGTYLYKVFSNDTLGNIGVSDILQLTTGTTAPTLAFVSPTDVKGAVVSRNFEFVNLTVDSNTAGNVDTCTFSINGTSKSMTKIGSGKNVICSRNETGLSGGIYTYSVFANDTLGNTGNSGNRTITIDTLTPTLTFVLPTLNNGVNQSNNSITINITAVDLLSRINSCTLEFNGTNQSMTKIGTGLNVTCTTTKTNLVDGTRTYKVFANDSANNIGVSSTRNFTVDTLPPIVSFSTPTPTEGIFQSSNSITINVSSFDINTFISACTLEFDGVNQSMSITGSGSNVSCILTKSSLNNASHSYIVYSNDSANNINNTGLRSFTVDNSKPVFVSLKTVPGDLVGLDPNASILVRGNITDSQSGVNNSLVFLENKLITDSSFVQNLMTFNSSSGFYELYINKSSAGTYNLRLNATDNATNRGLSTPLNISLQFERNWIISPSQLLLHAYSTTGNGTGLMTINNTGDLTQKFNITSNYTFTFFNETEQFNLPTTFKRLNVTATAANSAITLLQLNTSVFDASDNTILGVPPSRKINATVIVAQGQPILEAIITSEPLDVIVGDSGVIVQLQLENIGQGNSSNVSINLSLPDGWSVDAGTKDLSIGDLNTGEIATSRLEISISSSASLGNQSITLFSNGVNQTGSNLESIGLIFNDTQTIEVFGVQGIGSDDTVVISSSSSSGSGGGGGWYRRNIKSINTTSANTFINETKNSDKIEYNDSSNNIIESSDDSTNPILKENKKENIFNKSYLDKQEQNSSSKSFKVYWLAAILSLILISFIGYLIYAKLV